MPKEIVNNYGPSGAATISITQKVIVVKMKSDKYPEPFRFERSDFEGVLVAGQAHARISQDGTKLYGLRPITPGNYFCKFVKFAAKKDQAPAPRVVKAREGRKADGTTFPVAEHLEFTALLEITSGVWEGAEMPVSLWYHFKEYQTTGIASQIIGTAKSKVLLDQFLTVGGVDMGEVAIPWSENILPELESRLKKADKEFLVNLNDKGYPAAITAAPDMGKKKKSAKKKKK